MDRRWSSPTGSGLYLSLVLRPGKSLTDVWQLAFVTSLATAEAVSRLCALQARIKWPNDVLISGRKLAGILIETKSTAKHGVPNFERIFDHAVIVGIGVNVNTPSFPPEIANRATSLLLESDAHEVVDISAVETALLDCFETRYCQYLREGFAPILDAWRAFDCTAGLRVSVSTPEGIVTGTATGVDVSGDLILIREDGQQVRLISGEVIPSAT